MTFTHLAMLGGPALAGLLLSVLRSRRPPTQRVRILRDVITLRMVLRGADPHERRKLINAHHQWRTDQPDSTARTKNARRRRN
ncbi:hypothetical protein [Streptomyces sp. MA5143a]|uniref:hypothetical protein n=1 Tax=Streptomyces sp. MA5143a TaxID=2083010 RepID=UPI000D1B0831|nr:hypothetical protein [Streptomyces sp. MA5143a]SPF07460.1 hypothetical protein SMA5143A_8324 [Streptomyces sp. MA5143a]